MSSSRGTPSSAGPSESGQQVRRPRRQQISMACELCRRRKVKCDGSRPCSACISRGVECIFQAEVGETRTQAAKRKYEDLESAHDALLELVDIASSRLDGPDILSRVKHGEDPVVLLDMLKKSDPLYQTRLAPAQSIRRSLLNSLIQSTASVEQIVSFVPLLADGVLDSSILHSRQYKATRNRIVNANDFSKVVTGVVDAGKLAKTVDYAKRASFTSQASDDVDLEMPSYLVPAQPWSRLTTDDHFMSHLVSIFFNTYNVYWRYVEEDLFLKSMQTGNLSTEYCSPFLVNAICALACLNSEHTEAFSQDEDFISRGKHFHDEALRLWILEDGKQSLVNLQALVLISTEVSYRGNDRLGMAFLAIALQMNQSLEFPESDDSSALPMREYARARAHAAWSAHFFDVAAGLGLLQEPMPIDSRLGLLPNLPENWWEWSGSPYLRAREMLRCNALMRERCNLSRLTADVVQLLFSKQSNRSSTELLKSGTHMKNRLLDWYQLLPADLSFRKDLPPPLYELHGQYFCLIITLCSHMETLVPLKMSQEHPTVPHDTQTKPAPESMMYALQAASLLATYREAYGVKITLAFVFYTSAITCFTLLANPDFTLPQSQAVFEGLPAPFRDARSAFDESYRLLLGFGTRVMIARGVARMVYQTSKMSGTQAQGAARQVLEIVSEAAWRSTDAQMINSRFPNFLFAGNPERRHEARLSNMLAQMEKMAV